MSVLIHRIILDFTIAYGMPAALLLLASCVFALSARRSFHSWPVVMLTVLSGQLAFGESLGSLLGSITFWAALTYCQRDE